MIESQTHKSGCAARIYFTDAAHEEMNHQRGFRQMMSFDYEVSGANYESQGVREG